MPASDPDSTHAQAPRRLAPLIGQLAALRARAMALHDEGTRLMGAMDPSADDHAPMQGIVDRLARSVIRPLDAAVAALGHGRGVPG